MFMLLVSTSNVLKLVSYNSKIKVQCLLIPNVSTNTQTHYIYLKKLCGLYFSRDVSDCCSTPSEQFTVISIQEQVRFQMMVILSALSQTDTLRLILYSASSLKQRCVNNRHDSEPISAYTPNTVCQAEAHQIDSLWFDPTGARKWAELHSRRAR